MRIPPPDEVHLWWLDLDRGPVSELLLTPAERERFARIRRPGARERRIRARARMRELLGACLGVPPAEVPIAVAPGGRPFLTGGEVSFNLAHSGSLGVLALTRRATVGIDVELRRGRAPLPRALCEAEAARVAAAEDGEGQFLRHWTAKEAHLKALGTGIRHRLGDLEVRVAGEGCRVLRGPGAEHGWALVVLERPDGAIAALTASGGPFRLVEHEPE
jgi:4'-phosphopantetheinyl transferase